MQTRSISGRDGPIAESMAMLDVLHSMKPGVGMGGLVPLPGTKVSKFDVKWQDLSWNSL